MHTSPWCCWPFLLLPQTNEITRNRNVFKYEFGRIRLFCPPSFKCKQYAWDLAPEIISLVSSLLDKILCIFRFKFLVHVGISVLGYQHIMESLLFVSDPCLNTPFKELVENHLEGILLWKSNRNELESRDQTCPLPSFFPQSQGYAMGWSLVVMCLAARFETNKSAHCIACIVVVLTHLLDDSIYTKL